MLPMENFVGISASDFRKLDTRPTNSVKTLKWNYCQWLVSSLVGRFRASFVDSTPSLGVLLFFVVYPVCLSVCLSVTNIASFLFLDGIEPFLGQQLSMTKTMKSCSSIFDLGPLFPNAQNLLPKIAQNRL